MPTPSSLPGQKSRVFQNRVGETIAAAAFSPADYLLQPERYDCEGNWAFCRFDSEEIPAARMGFTRRGFESGKTAQAVDRNFLQLHLELVTREGLLLWQASGLYPAEQMAIATDRLDMGLQDGGTTLFTMQGWPHMACHFRSADGDAQADLEFDFRTVTTLPDCILPRAVFGMWEALGPVRGSVRYREKTTPVAGHVFFDHPRIIHQVNGVPMRQMYLYTPMYFQDGSYAVGYHALDETGRPIEYYCFGLYVDAAGRARFLRDAKTTAIAFDGDHIPESWHIRWGDGDLVLDVAITAQRDEIARSWGAANAPTHRKSFIYLPLVFKGAGSVTQGGQSRPVQARGLAEYYDISL